jgi:hypothetical protein
VTPLFEPGLRENPSPRGHLEGSFEFYDRAGTPYWDEVRRVVDEWFDRYPRDKQERLRTDLMSSNDRTSNATFWELLLHELYSRAGFQLEPHPALPNTTKRPDFLVSEGGHRFLVEARVVNDQTDDQRRQEKRRRAIYYVIDKVRPESFYIRLEILQDGTQQPRVRDLTSFLEDWLRTLDPDAAERSLSTSNDLRSTPTADFRSRNWHLRFFAIPVRAERRGGFRGPMLGIFPADTFIGDPSRGIRQALRDKGGRYDDVELPLVVALAIEGLLVNDEDIASALFGTTVWRLDARDPSVVIDRYRRKDGYFRPNRGRRVAAVLTVPSPRPMFAPRVIPRLWLNPWAAHPYVARRLWASRSLDTTTGEIREEPTDVTPSELLELTANWPPGEPFERR